MKYILLLLLLCIVAIFSLHLGRYSISVQEMIDIVLSQSDNAMAKKVLLDIRLPRILLAIFVGASLSVAGASFQTIFKNALASPDILGVTSGAAFGGVIGLLFGLSFIYVGLFSFTLGFITLLVTLFIARGSGVYGTVMVVLSGIVIGALMQSFISLTKYVADPQDVLPSITFYLLGSLNTNFNSLSITGMIVMALASLVILLLSYKLNALSLEDDEAKSLGVNVRFYRVVFIVCSTLISAAVVSVCGIVGWVGLLVPHIARLIFGSNTSKVVPLSLIIGAIFMLLVDDISRSLIEEEIPISIVTSVVGSPFFIYILYKLKGARL
ncbi:iron ABC transporter permease [Helicobacter sp. 11S02629-2]|uniref:FecCD family ABC transporter permease n=1 Tax=Helicobacter sp. 11S02629-2 TaxID=1476195 RepID=UPI000BA58F7D|nr:iron ABC transporter permease [Helicobacter sp. 11S02629-2]PAF45553.1 iron ABC transporter permease [Helicobacter sp. 11S02629-2]